VALIATDRADARRSFHPVRTTSHAWFFKPRGLSPKAVRKAQVQIRHRGGKVRRRHVPTVRVRSALSRSSRLRVKKPKPARGGRLQIVTAPTTPPTSDPGSACQFGSFSSSNLPGSCWRPYADDSPFNTPVPANPRISPDSAAAVKHFVNSWKGNDDLNYAPRFTAGIADTSWD
jgi:hypothetical protein